MVETTPVDALETIRAGLFVRFAQVAAATLFSYDVLLNLDAELKYVWAALSPRKQRPIKIGSAMFNLLYLVQRYLPLWDRVILDTYYMLGPSNAKSCEVTLKMSACMTFGGFLSGKIRLNSEMHTGITIIGIHISQCLLALRIWAVWLNSPSVLVMLIALALSCSIPAVFFFVRFVRGIHCPELYIPGTVPLQGCFCSTENKDLYLSWSMLMVNNTAAFIITSIPGIKAYRTGGRSNLVKVIYQDGVIYYASMFLASLINIVVILQLPSTFVIMVSPLERVLHSIITSHLILHLRKVAPRGYVQNWDTMNGLTTEELTIQEHTEMSFVSNALRTGTEPENQGR